MALGALFTAAGPRRGGVPIRFAPALPLLALLIVRAVAHLPAARSLLFGREADDKPVQTLSEWMQRTLPLVGVGMWLADWDASP